MSTTNSSKTVPSPTNYSHNCVLCNAKLASKEELQEHFRKHANKEIDNRGKLVKKSSPSVYLAKPVSNSIANGNKMSKEVTPEPSTSKTTKSSNVKLSKFPNRNGKTRAARKKSSATTVENLLEQSNEAQQDSDARETVVPVSASSSADDDRVKCDICDETFPTVSIAIQHKYRRHSDSKVQNFCLYCGQQFPIKYSLDKHLQSHPDDMKHNKDAVPAAQCQICGVAFYYSKALNYHMTSCHNKAASLVKILQAPPPSRKIKYDMAGQPQSVYYCHLCGAEYIIKYNLIRHLERHHSSEECNGMPQQLIKCKICDALFFNKKAFDNHTHYHNNEDILVDSEEQRQALITRVDQDFDYRRVLKPEEKYATRVERTGRNRRVQSAKEHDDSAALESKAKSKRVKRKFEHIDSDDSSILSSPSPVSDTDDEQEASKIPSNPNTNVA